MEYLCKLLNKGKPDNGLNPKYKVMDGFGANFYNINHVVKGEVKDYSVFDFYEDCDSSRDEIIDEFLSPHQSEPDITIFDKLFFEHDQPTTEKTKTKTGNAINHEDFDFTASSEEDFEISEEKKPRKFRSVSRKNNKRTEIKMKTTIKLKKRKRRRRSNLMKPGSQLYQFILQLLDDETKRDLIRWEKPTNNGIFRILNKEKVAKLWGEARNREMTYDSLSRGLRHYYSQGLLNAVNKKMHYQFTQKALEEWEDIRHKESIE